VSRAPEPQGQSRRPLVSVRGRGRQGDGTTNHGVVEHGRDNRERWRTLGRSGSRGEEAERVAMPARLCKVEWSGEREREWDKAIRVRSGGEIWEREGGLCFMWAGKQAPLIQAACNIKPCRPSLQLFRAKPCLGRAKTGRASCCPFSRAHLAIYGP
jgi:hypothetical protein